MFTGIIHAAGKLEAIRRDAKTGCCTLRIRAPRRVMAQLAIGSSIAINGACMSVRKKTADVFCVDATPETLQKTNLGLLRHLASVNLETPLRWNDTLHGHLVTGHVDGIGIVKTFKKTKRGHELVITFPTALKKYLAAKGSVAVNGVSLTIMSVAEKTFSVALIPLTEKLTNFGALKPRDRVNLEVDIVARYAAARETAGRAQRWLRTTRPRNTTRVAIVASSWHKPLVMRLLAGATQALQTKPTVYWAPGAFELPALAQRIARTGQYHGIIALGLVIKGETDHHRFVSEGATAGLQKVALESGIPLTFGVLTCENIAQAEARAAILPEGSMRVNRSKRAKVQKASLSNNRTTRERKARARSEANKPALPVVSRASLSNKGHEAGMALRELIAAFRYDCSN